MVFPRVELSQILDTVVTFCAVDAVGHVLPDRHSRALDRVLLEITQQ